MTILESLRSRMTARRESNTSTLVAAARRIATGETVDPADIEGALVAEGVTVEAFESMVELAHRRQGWHATRDKGPAAAVQRDKAAAELETARERFEAAREVWATTSQKLNARLAAAGGIVSAAADATQHLRTPANIPGPLGGKIAAADDAHVAAMSNVETTRRMLKDAKGRVRSELEWVDHKQTYNDNRYTSLADRQNALARWEKRVPELETALVDAVAAATAAEKTLNDLRADALKL